MTTTGTQAGDGTAGEPGPGGGPQVRVGRSVGAPLVHVWEVLVSPAGARALLGEGAVLGGKGEPYQCSDGTGGVLRSYHPLEQLRVTWHPAPDAPSTVVEVDLHPLGADGDSATRLELRQEHLGHGPGADDLARRWRDSLDRVAALAEA